MTEQTWINLISQVPLVGAFIWFAVYITKTYLDALNKQNEGFEKRTAAIVQAMTEMNHDICNKIDQQKRPTTRRKTTKPAA